MSPGVDVLVSDIARRIEADLPALTVEITGHFVEVIPEFTHDDAVRRLMVASTSANLVTIVDLLGHGIAPERIAVPAAAEYARRFAQRHLSLEALLLAYRLGEHRLLQWALRYLAELEVDAATAIATTQRLAQTVHGCIDHVIEGLIAIYEEELRWDAARPGGGRDGAAPGAAGGVPGGGHHRAARGEPARPAGLGGAHARRADPRRRGNGPAARHGAGVPGLRRQLHRRGRPAAPAQEHRALPAPPCRAGAARPAGRAPAGGGGGAAGLRAAGPADVGTAPG